MYYFGHISLRTIKIMPIIQKDQFLEKSISAADIISYLLPLAPGSGPVCCAPGVPHAHHVQPGFSTNS